MRNLSFGLIQLVTRGFIQRFFWCIAVLFLSAASLNPSKAYAAKFSIYDKVEVYNTGGVGLRLRQWYSTTSSIVTKMPDGTQMTVYGGPYQADGYNWWYLYGYVDGSSYGYSAGYYYGYAAEDYLKLVSASCTYSISPSSQSFDSNGGSGNVSVTTSSSCSWTATSNTSWITITSGSNVSGNGTVNYSVASNSSTSSRTGTMTIAGQTFTVTQSAASSPPTVTTGTYQTVSATSVQLFGTVNPNGLTTTGWFEWGTTSSYGNTTNKESLGGGTGVVQMLHTISGLTASTTYHFRAVAQSSAGTSHGEDMSFTTEAPAATKPTVTTNAATSVTSTTAMLNGTVNPNGAATTGWFEWGTTSSYGNTTQTFSGGSGTSDVTMSWSISSLSPNTTYHFRAVGQNSAGTTYGYDMTFTTESCTYSISSSSQSFNSNGGSGSISVTTSSGCSWTATSNTSWITITSGSSVSGNGTVNYSVASNSSTSSRTGTMTIAGQTFTVTQSPASSPPTVTTGTYQTISSTSVQLFGTVNPNGLTTTGWFEWGTTSSYGNTTNKESLGGGTGVVQMLHTISGLSASTTYHFRAVGKNSSGTSYGEDMSFTTEAPAATKPTVTTNAATSVTSTTAMLNGTVNPNGATTTGWFEWGTTSSYGNTTQTFSGGSGTSDVTMSWSISGLSPDTTYHFRAVGQNSAGTTYGSDMTFTTGSTSGTPSPSPSPTPTPTPKASPTPTPEETPTIPPLPSPEISPTPTVTSTPTPEATPTSTTTKIAAGVYHSLAVKSDGTVWAWGSNVFGQLGDGTTNTSYPYGKSTPVQVSSLGGVIAVACGDWHSLAVKSDGTVWAWGSNGDGQLGDGTTTHRNTPVQVSSLSGIIAVAGGDRHSLAVKSDGTVWAWGNNWGGQLGDGTTTHRNTPVQVSSLSGIIAVAAGESHSLALKSDGTVWAWGYYWSVEDRNTPVQVSNLSGVIAVAAGDGHSLALKSDGTVWAWGYNEYGALGIGTKGSSSTPVQVSSLSGIIAVAGGDRHSLAVKSDGTVWAWGYNGYGQLGDGTTTQRNTPVQVSNLSGVIAVAGGPGVPGVPDGWSHSLAVKSDGTVWAWGNNWGGQLGDGTNTDRTIPVQVDINVGQTEEYLLEKYAPILYMHEDERFYPIRAEEMLTNSDLYKEEGGTITLVYDRSLTTLEYLMNNYNETTYYLKLKDGWDEGKDKDYWKSSPTVYGRQFDSEGYTVLQYWFFYIYNDWDNIHEGDWELIQIILNKDKEPKWITYSIHNGGKTFDWNNSGMRKVSNHPLVYVTLGGHGSWNKSGDNVWFQGKVACLECTDKTSALGDVLVPSTMSITSDKYKKYQIEDLSEVSKDHWIYWEGYWGDINNTVEGIEKLSLPTKGPSSPPYIDYINKVKKGKKSNKGRWDKPYTWAKKPRPSNYTICTSANSKVTIHDTNAAILLEHCNINTCGNCPNIIFVYSEKDLVFDVYSLDGNEVDLKISRHKRTGEEYEVEFNMLEIPKSGKASLAFSPEQNPTFAIEIDHDRDGFFDSHRLPDFLEVK